MGNKLELTRADAYEVTASDDERSASSRGYFKEEKSAQLFAVGCGWYGSNGTVRSTKNLYEDAEGNLYTVKKAGKYVDLERERREKMAEKIASKLTREEIEYLKEEGVKLGRDGK